MSKILWVCIGQSNEVGTFPERVLTTTSTTTGSSTTFNGVDTTGILRNDIMRVYGGDFSPPTTSGLTVTAVTASTITVDYNSSSGDPAFISKSSGRIRSIVGLPNSGVFWNGVASNYSASTGDLVQVVEYGIGAQSFITDWIGVAVADAGNSTVVLTEGTGTPGSGVGNFDPELFLGDVLTDIESRMIANNGITPYDEVWLLLQHGQEDTKGEVSGGLAPYSSTGATTDAFQATFYGEAIEGIINYFNNNLTTTPTRVIAGSTIPSASYGDNDAMDNVIEVGVRAGVAAVGGITEVGPMMHTEFATNWSVTTYPHNGLFGASAGINDDHTTTEGQEYMATVYSDYILQPIPLPTLTTPYANRMNISGDVVSAIDFTANWVGAASFAVTVLPNGLTDTAGSVAGTVVVPTGTFETNIAATGPGGTTNTQFQWTTLTTGDPTSGINVTINKPI